MVQTPCVYRKPSMLRNMTFHNMSLAKSGIFFFFCQLGRYPQKNTMPTNLLIKTHKIKCHFRTSNFEVTKTFHSTARHSQKGALSWQNLAWVESYVKKLGHIGWVIWSVATLEQGQLRGIITRCPHWCTWKKC